ncbi:hypothetical protein DL766_003089 [Monosporascus sp. MC13-8B]|nr:hypothetical protein DL766_003089 [Monosporascus sp. MC13-8B]
MEISSPFGSAVITSPSPRPAKRAEVSQRRQTPTSGKQVPLRVPESETKRVSWPEEFKWVLPLDRLARLESSAPIDVSFFTSLNYDARRTVYDAFWQEAGLRQLIFCPSISRTKQAKEMHNCYTISTKRDDMPSRRRSPVATGSVVIET